MQTLPMQTDITFHIPDSIVTHSKASTLRDTASHAGRSTTYYTFLHIYQVSWVLHAYWKNSYMWYNYMVVTSPARLFSKGSSTKTAHTLAQTQPEGR